ncbi:hypothetical protein LCGC14_0609780 [marine sediment metagenome]|uniref:Uncharacterized protein n=1 Tax=marine sediment metagenome TaxID=412755 RepID=A0A0F9RS62_9ZZZZ
MSKARPKAKQRKKDILLELLPGQRVKQRGKPAGKRAPSETVREVVRGAGIVKRLIEQAKTRREKAALLKQMTRKPK